MNIKPLADRVLVLPNEAEQKTAAGIIIPDTAKEKPMRGKVLAVGQGTKDHEMTVKVGDEVLYGKYSGTEVEIDGTKYMIMKEGDIYAII
jgi:chaperonin GroES